MKLYLSFFLKNKIVSVDNRKVKLQIWDTAGNVYIKFLFIYFLIFKIYFIKGQERFRSVTHAYYRDAQALMLLYDVTSQSSFGIAIFSHF